MRVNEDQRLEPAGTRVYNPTHYIPLQTHDMTSRKGVFNFCFRLWNFKIIYKCLIAIINILT